MKTPLLYHSTRDFDSALPIILNDSLLFKPRVYGNNFGGTLGWQDFKHYYGGINGDDYWKIQVPNDDYFDTYPNGRPPVGDIEMYITEVFQKNYYNWTGDIYYHMLYNIYGRRNSNHNWHYQDDEYAYFYNIDVDAEISFQGLYGQQGFWDNDNTGMVNPAHYIGHNLYGDAYIYSIMFQNAASQPVAKFKQVHGVLGYQRYVENNGEYFLNLNF